MNNQNVLRDRELDVNYSAMRVKTGEDEVELALALDAFREARPIKSVYSATRFLQYPRASCGT